MKKIVGIFILLFVMLAMNSEAEDKVASKKFLSDKGSPYLPKKLVKTFPEEIQKGYKIAINKCSNCHVIQRALNTIMYDKGDWKRYVKRMMNKPNSNISKDEGKLIYRFLKYDQENRKEPEADKFYIAETMEKPDTITWFSEDKKPKNWKD